MDFLKFDSRITETVVAEFEKRGYRLSERDLVFLVELVREEALSQFVKLLIEQIETILEIDPALSDREILQKMSKSIVEFLDAEAATLRIYDPSREKLVAFGSYPDWETDRREEISLEDTVAGEVVKTRVSQAISDLSQEKRYSAGKKERMARKGIKSMLAVPISLLRFSVKDVDTEGVLQIYFRQSGKVFSSMETRIAETLARRVSYVIARKRILDLQELNAVKDKIVEQIFVKIGRREGIKMKEIFNLVIPEVADVMRIQRCALFGVTEDRQNVVLEAGFPEVQHGIGKILSVKEPYIDAVVNQRGPFGEFEHEKIYPNYIHIHHPRESRLLPSDLKNFLESQEIHSVLYIPLKVNEAVKYFLVFDAQAYHRRFTDEKIEIFIFLGKELMKALRLEKLDDILHDFKNPAIAVAGFARRLRKYLAADDFSVHKQKIDESLEIILQETTRIQELALTLYEEGRETTVDMTQILRRRFQINQEAVLQLDLENIRAVEKDFYSPLPIRCSPLMVERIFDNLLNNASKAIPEGGGELSIRSYAKDSWAVAEIANTGEILEEDRERYLQGEGKGRGLQITGRLVKRLGGKIELESQNRVTNFRVLFPLQKS